MEPPGLDGPRPEVTTETRPGGAERRPSPWAWARRRWRGALAFSVYGGLTAILFASLLPHLTTEVLGGGDGILFAWWIKEVPTALFHGHDPLVSHLLLHPGPVNGMWNTSVVIPALLVAPVTATAGPLASVNLLLIISPVVSATSAYWMCRRFNAGPVLAWVGGLLYGFGPFVVDESLGHIHMTLAWFPPVAVVLLREILVDQRRSPARTGALLGALAVVQLLCGEELLASSALIAAIAIIVLVLTNRRNLTDKFRHAAVGIGAAAGVGGVLAAVPLGVQFFGPNRPTGPLLNAKNYVADLAAFVAPTRMSRFDPLGLGHLGSHVTGNLAEDSGYLGPALLLLALVAFWWGRGDRVVRFAGVMAFAAAVLSLGARLHVDGHVTQIPLPWALFWHLPLLDSLLPARLSVFVLLFLTLLLTRGLTYGPATPVARASLAVVMAVSALFLWPRPPLITLYQPPQPAFFTSTAVRQLPAGSLVVVAPPPSPAYPTGMLWQAEAGMRFRILSGYAAPWGDDVPTDPVNVALVALEQGRGLPASVTPTTVRADLQRMGARAVVVGPGAIQLPTLEALFTTATGRPPVAEGGVIWWRIGSS